jgi:hypothetical protein
MKIEDSQDKNIVLKMNFGIRIKNLHGEYEYTRRVCVVVAPDI